MLETISARMQGLFARLGRRGVLTKETVEEAADELRVSLLEADVALAVAKEFVYKVKSRALGSQVLPGLTPQQHFMKVVRDELTELLGASGQLALSGRPAVVLLAGLQGSGKTTTAAKLAGLLSRRGRRPVLAACDLSRPAAVEQLASLASSLGIECATPRDGESPLELASRALLEARAGGADTLLVDTAGRMHIDAELMAEMRALVAALRPSDVVLVLDGMTGQDAVNVAGAFGEQVGVTGFILAKMDGDSRGGAALTLRHATGRPVLFVGTGERPGDLEEFNPQGFADRVLGLGDLAGLIGKAQAAMDAEGAAEAERFAKKARKAELTLEDFLSQMKALRRMGPLSGLLEMLPGGAALPKDAFSEAALSRVEAIILSMTRQERRKPEVLNGSRRKRIAMGSGTTVAEVNSLVKRFEEARKMMKRLTRSGKMQRQAPFVGF